MDEVKIRKASPSSFSRGVLVGLPSRAWDASSTYDSLLIVPTGKRHDSKFHLIAIVGCVDNRPVEIAACCDDIEVRVPELLPLLADKYVMDMFRCDMSYPAGIAHWWGASFEVGVSLSSTEVTIRPRRAPLVGMIGGRDG